MAQRTQAPPAAEPQSPPRPDPVEGRARRFLRELGYRLFQPVDGASLAVFRILFGSIMVWEVYRYFSHDWIQRYWVEPSFHFTYHGFGWVEPLPGRWMEVLFAVLGALAVCIALGLFYRVAAALFFVAFTYTFLLEQARYLNHFYLVCLLSFLLAIVPAHRVWSVDAALSKPRWRETVPTWSLWLLRAQIGAVFFFAGVAKLNGDWLHGEPLRMWLAARTDFAIIGRFFTEEWAPWLFSYGGLLFDLAVIPLLIWPRTRPLAFLAAVGFHMTNQQLFSIGIFPFLALGTALLFFPPDWPRFRWLRARRRPPRQPVVASWPTPPRGWRLTACAGRAARCPGRLPRAAGADAAPPFRDPGQRQLDRGGPSLLLAHEAPRQGRRRAGSRSSAPTGRARSWTPPSTSRTGNTTRCRRGRT